MAAEVEKYYKWLTVNWLNIFTGFYIFIIIYSTIVPFDFISSARQIPNRIEMIQLNPFGRGYASLPMTDMLANILFFMPLGLLLALRIILKEYRPLFLKEWITIVLTGSGISLFVEVLQIFTVNRFPSSNDILTNTIGTFAGALLMVLIYLRFRRGVKTALITTFARKPEMIISGLLFVLIVLSQSAPLTFNLYLPTVKQQILELLADPWRVDYLLSRLLSHLIIYGTFTYFLYWGLQRYHPWLLKFRRGLIILVALIILPVMIEIFQLILPARNHSLADILLADFGILYGFFVYLFQKKITGIPLNPVGALTLHKRFIHLTGVVYFCFFINRFYLPVDPLNIFAVKHLLPVEYLFATADFYGKHRMEALTDVVKEVFAFLPAGFILSLIWYREISVKISGLLRWSFIILFPLAVQYTSVLISRNTFFLPVELPAAATGLWLGNMCWKIYEFMILSGNRT